MKYNKLSLLVKSTIGNFHMKNVEAVIAQKYNFRFAKYGAVPEASLWFSEDRQFMRFKLIADVLDQKLKRKRFFD